MTAAGISPADFGYVDFIVGHESGWCPTVQNGELICNPSQHGYSDNRAYGLGQALPGNKMAAFGADWQTNPVTQLVWANSYAQDRYGSWAAAYNYWQIHRVW